MLDKVIVSYARSYRQGELRERPARHAAALAPSVSPSVSIDK
jgi:hypothetical protein